MPKYKILKVIEGHLEVKELLNLFVPNLILLNLSIIAEIKKNQTCHLMTYEGH